MPVPAGVVGPAFILAIVTPIDMVAHFGGTTLLDNIQYLQVVLQGSMLGNETLSIFPENVCQFEGRLHFLSG